MISRRKIRQAQEYYENMPPLQMAANEQPMLPGIWVNNDGSLNENVDIQPERKITFMDKAKPVRDRIADALLGKRANPTDSIELGDDTMNATISQNPRVGGLLNDLASGYRENYATGFAAPNWGQNETSDGRQKGFGYRIGEGLGSIGRFIDSPFGRGLIAAGLNNALGYDDSVQEGLTAAVGRQKAMTADKLYRQQLMRDYGYTEDDLKGIRGNIDTNLFNSLTKSQNSAESLAIRKQTAESMNKLRDLQIEKQKIINSNLPEVEKAKLLKLNAEAEHAEELVLARIQYLKNSTMNPLGWANFNLKQEQYEDKKASDEKKEKQTQQIIDSLGGGGTTPPPKTTGRAF